MRWLLGPESFWLLVYGLSWLVSRFNIPATEIGNAWMGRIGLWMFPLVAVPLSFWLAFAVLPTYGQGRVVLWSRLWFATFVGLNAAMMQIFGTIDFHDSRNSGSANYIFVGAMVATLVFAICSLVLWMSPWKWGVKDTVSMVAGALVWGFAMLVAIGSGSRVAMILIGCAPLLVYAWSRFVR
ncbi:MAG: hypothetical protein ACREUE_03075 [Panacagrimonas sp.]